MSENFKTKLSHSALSRYQTCAKSYYWHYKQRIRPTTTSSALLFGDSLDKAINCLLLKEGDAYARFIEAFTYAEINKVKEYLPTSEKLVYANADFDADLLNETHYKTVNDAFAGGEDHLEWQIIADKKKSVGFDGLTLNEKRYFNYVNWICLTEKAKYLIEAYKKQVIPKIIKVISVQEQINLDNGEGDGVVGFVDLIAEIEGHGVVILDNKTSSRPYDYDAVLKSVQLGTYTYALSPKYNTNKAGFIVMKKALSKKKKCSICNANGDGSRARTCDAVVDNKRCAGEWVKTPKAEIQILIDVIPENTQNIIVENIDELNKCIKAELFPRNMEKCENWYGNRCPYSDLCFKNSMKGLIKAE